MTRRAEPIVDFNIAAAMPALRDLLRVLQRHLGRLVSFADTTLLHESGGYTVTNAATTPGTALTFTRTNLNFGDSGVDQVRSVVRGNNSGAGSVTVQVYDVTNALALCTTTVTGVTVTTYSGDWTVISPTGIDQELEVRVIGDGVFDPVLYNVHLQQRTLRARST